ncbi:MAG: C-GCAxxG-C-C family protein [Desulfovibrionaceae bacterium]
MSDVADRAVALFRDDGFLCAEAVLLAVCEALGLEYDAVPRVATGLCSGLSRAGGPCGALLGGVLAVNLAHGRDHAEPKDARVQLMACYSRVNKLVNAFRENFGATDCTTLCGCDLTTPEGQLRFQAEDVAKNRCFALMREAAEMALDAADS